MILWKCHHLGVLPAAAEWAWDAKNRTQTVRFCRRVCLASLHSPADHLQRESQAKKSSPRSPRQDGSAVVWLSRCHRRSSCSAWPQASGFDISRCPAALSRKLVRLVSHPTTGCRGKGLRRAWSKTLKLWLAELLCLKHFWKPLLGAGNPTLR